MPRIFKIKTRLRLWLLLLLIVAGGAFWMRLAPQDTGPSVAAKERAAQESKSAAPSNAAEEAPDSQPVKAKTPPADKINAPARLPPPDAALLAKFKEFHARLRGGDMPRDEVLAALKSLKQQVHDLPPETAASTLIALLQSGEDASTGLAFVVGDEGVLAEAPSYRVALLDFLGQTDPEAAVAYSRELLARTALPDEYALALRNLAWLNHEGALNPAIRTYFTAMLDHVEWRTHPTAGYLEAFDVAAAVGGPEMAAELASVLRLTASNGEVIPSPVNRAAFIALDRIMLREPDTIAGLYTADPAFLDFAPNHRASLLSRLDPESPTQAQALRTYLHSTPADSEELGYFARVFPNGNFFEGNRLVTSWETAATTTTALQRDRAALGFINALLTDPAYGNLVAPLQVMHHRLQSFASGSAPAP